MQDDIQNPFDQKAFAKRFEENGTHYKTHFGNVNYFSQSNEKLYNQLPGVCFSLCFNYLEKTHQTTCDTGSSPLNILNNDFWSEGQNLCKTRGTFQNVDIPQSVKSEILVGQKITMNRFDDFGITPHSKIQQQAIEIALDFSFVTQEKDPLKKHSTLSLLQNIDSELDKLENTGSSLIFLNRANDYVSGHAVCMSHKTAGNLSKFTLFDPDEGEISFIYSSAKHQTARAAFKTFLTDYVEYLAQPKLFESVQQNPQARLHPLSGKYVVEKPGYTELRVLSIKDSPGLRAVKNSKENGVCGHHDAVASQEWDKINTKSEDTPQSRSNKPW